MFTSQFQRDVHILSEHIKNDDPDGIFLTGSASAQDMSKVTQLVQTRTNLQRMNLDCEW